MLVQALGRSKRCAPRVRGIILAGSLRRASGGSEEAVREENNVKPNTISQRRRHILIAGLAGAAAPVASAVAGECGVMQNDAETIARFSTAEGKLVVSGRIVDARC